MASVTFGTRIGGFWLMSRFRSLKKLERILRYTPGSIIAAIVAPAALMNGVDDAIASMVVVLVMIKSRNLLLSMCAGIGIILLIRLFS
jgi:uncharacterized membrane protein